MFSKTKWVFFLLSHFFASFALASSWQGFAILGDGKLCGAYSDDHRVTSLTKQQGLHNLYFQDFRASYVSSTFYALLDKAGQPIPNRPLDGSVVLDKRGFVIPTAKPTNALPDAVGSLNFFAIFTRSILADGTIKRLSAFCHPDDAIIFELSEETDGKTAATRQFQIKLATEPQAARTVTFQGAYAKSGILFARWSNNAMLGVAVLSSASSASISTAGNATAGNMMVTIRDRTRPNAPPLRVALIVGVSEIDIAQKNVSLRKKRDVALDAEEYWNNWLNEGKLPLSAPPEFLEMFKRNLYAVKAATLGGQVPADLSGQYLAGGMPQLYPRDAMMVARVFLLTRHYAEARAIIRFWASPSIPRKNENEWYAKYDAFLRPTDEGAGLKADEPQWDANGYLIRLVDEYRLRRKEREYLVDKDFIYRFADFIASNLDQSGLLYELGRREWRGYLALTNMVDAAALRTAASVADEFADYERAQRYRETAGRIDNALAMLFDSTRNVYVNLRLFGPRLKSLSSLPQIRFWDASINFSVVWGYPNHRALAQSNEFFLQYGRGEQGGLRYLEKLDVSGDIGYAPEYSDVFLNITAAAAQYHVINHKMETARKMLDWLKDHRNVYGLVPERLSVDGATVGAASPHFWSAAETVAAIWSVFATVQEASSD